MARGKKTIEGLAAAFGRNVTRRMEAARLTQGELADRAGLGRTFVNGLCCGRFSPSLATIVTLSKALGCGVGDLAAVEPERQCPHCNGTGFVPASERLNTIVAVLERKAAAFDAVLAAFKPREPIHGAEMETVDLGAIEEAVCAYRAVQEGGADD